MSLIARLQDVNWSRVALAWLLWGAVLVTAYRGFARLFAGRRHTAVTDGALALAAAPAPGPDAEQRRDTGTIRNLAPVSPPSRRERKDLRVIRLPSGAISRRQTQQARLEAALAKVDRTADLQKNVIIGLVVVLFMVLTMFSGFHQAHRANQQAINEILAILGDMQSINGDTQSAMLTLLGLTESQARSWKEFDKLREEFRQHASDILRATGYKR